MKHLGAAALAATLLVTACAKKEKEEGRILSPDEAKTAIATGAWIFQHEAVVYGPDDVDHGPSEPCKLDDVYRFDLSGDASVQWGANECNPSFPTASGSYGSWEIAEHGAVLKLSYTRAMPGAFGAGDVATWGIDYLSDRKMVLKRTVYEPGKSYVLYDTYVKRS
ncbi:hypothetical protein GCM10023184_34740 [Flaviaesturariibacter amylovorans]|uniref:Lipocalin-like domain-containing protein n=2 Tax=Flaviaesturariibacter amylovorans TaxID=1084520 RepID=A0ABP8HES5_9BACT